MKIKRSLGERIFECFNILFMLAVIIIMAYPLLYTIFASFSDANKFIAHNGILLAPIGFSAKAYEMVGKNSMILRGYINTLIIVGAGTTLNIVLTALGAYFLSTKGPMFRKPVAFLIVLTMYFSGGIIPMYFNVMNMGLS